MEITVGKLRETLELLAPAIPRKPSLPILDHVLLQDGQVIATDLEQTVIVALPEAVETLVIPHRSTAEMLKHIPANQTVALTANESALTLSWTGGQATLNMPEPDDYPPLPVMEPAGEETLDGDILVSALHSVVDYCDTESSRPVLMGVAMEFGDRVTVAAADGFRLAVRDLSLGFPQPEGVPPVVVIPAGAVRLLGQLWKKAPDEAQADLFASIAQVAVARRPMEVAVNSDYLRAHFGRVTLHTQLVQGTFPSYRLLIPDEFTSRIWAWAQELERGCRTIEQVARKGSNIIRLVWSTDTLNLSARAEETDVVNLSIPVRIEGREGRVALKAGYLLAYLQGKEGMVELCVNTPSSPVLFRYAGAPLVVVMPMHVSWDDGVAGQPEPEAPTDEEEEEEDTPKAQEATSESPEEAAAEAETEAPRPARKGRGRRRQE